jgi:hypothetical protein
MMRPRSLEEVDRESRSAATLSSSPSNYPAIKNAVYEYADRLVGKVVVDITNPVNTETFDDVATPPGTARDRAPVAGHRRGSVCAAGGCSSGGRQLRSAARAALPRSAATSSTR